MSEKGPGKYKDTVTLPETAFPMRGDLAKREPEILAQWDAMGLYEAIGAARADAEPFILHDGPPYSNGHIHYGHILNKILKDLVVKHKTMMGKRAPYIPGWDTHGLPIELAVERELGAKRRDMTQAQVRAACRAYAEKFIDIQRTEFKRLGVLGDWQRPYLTLSPVYERAIVKALASFARGGFLYRGKKPVYWCPRDRTALAEAEIEYKDKTSPSVYVRFPLVDFDAALLGPGLADARISLPIWTTTPWTLPANLAIVLHREVDYVALPSPRGDGEYFVCAAALAAAFAKAIGGTTDGAIAIGRDALACLEGVRYQHPFLDAPSGDDPRFRVWFADYVTTEQGTGLVHTAPGHGTDDYKTGVAHGLEPYAPLDDRGRYTEDAPAWLQGKSTDEANPLVVANLHESGALLNPPTDSLAHSYPHCWRCKGPILFRATSQWFLSIDQGGLRDRALAAIRNEVQWIPPWGENRIYAMIEHRPDWVLSRQRLWGTPIPAFYCGACQRPHADAATMDHIAERFGREGADAWWTASSTELVPPGTVCDGCGAGPEQFEKEHNILDVWFESGVSWLAIADQDAQHADIDLYLEGSDQHRGWFHSSLLVGVGIKQRAPYKQVLTHGFVLDSATGVPFSKSEIEKAKAEGKKVTYTPPETTIAKSGAEMFRLWVGSTDFRTDIPYSQALIDGVSDWYRKLRNTARFILGNLADFDPAAHGRDVVAAHGQAVDRYVLAQVDDLVARCVGHGEAYEFHASHRALVDFVTVVLSALYGDVTKDRMYTDARSTPRRRAAQVVQYEALRAITLLSAPVLCFTAEDIWAHLPKRPGDPPSVHLATYPTGARLAEGDRLAADFAVLIAWRERVNKAIEPFRAAKHKSLDARVTLHTPAADREVLARHADELADLCIVSSVVIVDGDAAAAAVEVTQHGGVRCERCWKWFAALSTRPGAPGDVCDRCAIALAAQ